MADRVNVSFGEPADPIAYLREREGSGDRPMWWLAQTLRLPAAGPPDPAAGRPGYVWPWAAGYDDASGRAWALSPDERAVLGDLYTDAQLDGFVDFGGFIGYRVGIDDGGNWIFFVAGD
jgi:hypothetical protein